MPTTVPPIAIAASNFQLSDSNKPAVMPAKIKNQVKLTPAQMGQTLIEETLLINQKRSVIPNIENRAIKISIIQNAKFKSQNENLKFKKNSLYILHYILIFDV